MANRQKYKTRQRSMLLQYLKTISGTHATASEICDHFKKMGCPIGQSTVYRQLEELMGEGLVRKCFVDNKTSACFEYAAPEDCSGLKACFHCKCEKCGKLLHLRCEELENVQAHLYGEHHFKLSPAVTVFYGLCEACSACES